jgi:hypothetical protein
MAATQTAPITLELAYSRSTKTTNVFTSDDPNAAVTTLYVRKDALAEPPPKITLTIATAPAAE